MRLVMPRQKHARAEAGFTLVELMATIAVALVLIVVAVPSFERFFERYRLRSAVDDTLDIFAAARQGAVESDRNVNVTFGASTTAWCVGAVQQASPAPGDVVPVTPTACECSSAPDACLVAGKQLVASAGTKGVTIGAGGATFTFDSKNGTLDPLATQSIDFISPKGNFGLTVRVTPLGQARACVPTGKPSIPGYYSC